LRCDVQGLGWGESGKEIRAAEVFKAGDFVDISGTSKGRGFQGVVKRFNVKGQPASMGTHESFRNIGSIGARKYPGKVWKNQKMPGHMGNESVCVQNLEVVQISEDGNLVFVKGAVPGPRGGFVTLKRAVKRASKNSRVAA
jgi:large subunit ribosomal protein L3